MKPNKQSLISTPTATSESTQQTTVEVHVPPHTLPGKRDRLLARIFEEAALREESPAHAARRHVDHVLSRARDAAQSGSNPDASDSHSA